MLPCGVYLWQQRVSGVKLPRSWQQLCGSRLSSLVCPWLAPPTLSACCVGVFVSPFWAALVSLADLELSIHQASWHPKLLHEDYMPHPSKLGLDEHGLDAGGVCTVQDLKIGDAVLPFDS